MHFADIAFFFFAALAVIPAILCVFVSNNIVRAAFLLMLTFWGVAGLYATLNADFLMAVQLIVYVGGILVLILFGVMLSRRVKVSELPVGFRARSLGIFGIAAFGFILWELVIRPTGLYPLNGGGPADTSTIADIGSLFLTKFLLPFEFVSVLLLGALIGSVILARKEFDDQGKPVVTR